MSVAELAGTLELLTKKENEGAGPLEGAESFFLGFKQPRWLERVT